ncbi:hypothetical protein N7G274_007447 [Stereocaulon virgatum]|uniref:Uncharacterized protein n=1 Tax=Stereocaulon virgatum TaxID=373712 RepID=A0ABR4A3G1_9LECA
MWKIIAQSLIASLLCNLARPGEGSPLSQGLAKRGQSYCFPINPPRPLHWWDCANAVLQINAENPNFNNVPYSFGTELGATYSDELYTWVSGTCVIEMAIESSVNQVATWNSIKTAALRVIQACVRSASQLGGTYVDRRASDPAGRSSAPSLHVWVLPVGSDESDTNDSKAAGNVNSLATCAAQHRSSSPPTTKKGCMWDFLPGFKSLSGIGGGR